MRFASAIIVHQSPNCPHHGTLRLGARMIPCTLGPSGTVMRKQEGDAATPVGRWPMRCLYYRPDRVSRPRTGLATVPITPQQGWCDAAEDRFYNRPVSLPYPASTETLYRDDHLYDFIVVLGHNDAPVVPGHGSCIFFHLMSDNAGPTAGCVAVRPGHMISILQICGPQTQMLIR